MNRSTLSLTFVIILILSGLLLNGQMDMEVFPGMKARIIGPVGMSGGIAAVVAADADPVIIYVECLAWRLYENSGRRPGIHSNRHCKSR